MIKIGTLNFSYLDGQDIAVLSTDFVIEIGRTTYIVPQGEHWDGASIPPRAWGLLAAHPFDRFHRRPSCYHDYAYSGWFGESKFRADLNYYRLLRAEGYPRHKALLELAALTLFGWTHWKGGKVARAAALVALALFFSGCASTLDKTRNADITGAIIDGAEMRAGSIEAHTVAQGETVILADYTEDSSIWSIGTPLRKVKITMTGEKAVEKAPEIFAGLCEAFQAVKLEAAKPKVELGKTGD